VLLATAGYLWLMDTRSGISFVDDHLALSAWMLTATPYLLLLLIIPKTRAIRALDLGLLAAAAVGVGFLPYWLQVSIIFAPALAARIRPRDGPFQRWWHALVAAACVAVAVVAFNELLGVVDWGDIAAPSYLVSWPVLLQDGFATGAIVAGLALVCFQQVIVTISLKKQLVIGATWLACGVLGLVIVFRVQAPPCQDYAEVVHAECLTDCDYEFKVNYRCLTDCDYEIEDVVHMCEAQIEDGLLTRDAARTATGACLELKARCAEEQKEERRSHIHRQIEHGDSNLCRNLPGASDVCEALFGVIEPGIDKQAGRSTPDQRKTVKRYLEKRGYKRIWGYIVAQHAPNQYEAAWMRSTRWGPVPTDNHFILETTMTEYASKGTFSMWSRKTGSENITLVSGFTETWDVYEEDPFGSVIQAIWDAPAGRETSQATKDALLGLCILEGWY